MHTIKVAVLDRRPGSRLLARAGEGRPSATRLHLLPPFRRRLIEVPFGFHHPRVDRGSRLRPRLSRPARRPSPHPAGRARWTTIDLVDRERAARSRPAALGALVPRRASPPAASRSVGKIHHAVADGVAVAGLLANVLAPADDTAGSGGPRRCVAPGAPAVARSIAPRRVPRSPAAGATPARARPATSIRNLLAVARRGGRRRSAPPTPLLDAPSTSLNGSLSCPALLRQHRARRRRRAAHARRVRRDLQ